MTIDANAILEQRISELRALRHAAEMVGDIEAMRRTDARIEKLEKMMAAVDGVAAAASAKPDAVDDAPSGQMPGSQRSEAIDRLPPENSQADRGCDT